jgi:hypothetical protein
MEGLTLSELADALGIPQKTVEMRLFRTGIKPIMRGVIYDKSALEVLKNTPGRGRPKKQPVKRKSK